MDYRLNIKDANPTSSSILTQSIFPKQKHIKSLLMQKKHIMQALLKKLQSIGTEPQREENFECFKPILQFFVLIVDICKNYNNYFSASSPFYTTLKSSNIGIKGATTLEETFRNHSILLEGMKLNFFENSRVSKYLLGIFNVLITKYIIFLI